MFSLGEEHKSPALKTNFAFFVVVVKLQLLLVVELQKNECIRNKS